MTPEAWDFLGKLVIALPAILAAFLGWRNSKDLGHIQDGMKSALDVAKVEKDNAKVAQATAEGQEKGRLLGESEAAARK